MGVGVLSNEQVRDYSELWRSLARQWADRAGKRSDPHAVRLRQMAQMALYAAYEAERLLHAREHRFRGAAPTPVAAVTSAPPATAEPLRHDPVAYAAAWGPVSLAGRRARSGPYSGRRAARVA